MKRLLSALIVGSVLVATSALAEMYVGKVDIQRVMNTVDQGKILREQLKKEFEIKQASLRKEEDALRKMQQEYQDNSAGMTEKEKAAKQGLLQQKIEAWQQLAQRYQSDIEHLEQNVKTSMLAKIRDIVIDVSKKEGVDATFESASTQMFYAQKEKDFTDEVVKLYNAQNPQQ